MVNPLYLLLPSTVVTSYAFMLPVSTPPNAIAYSYGHLKMMDMVGHYANIINVNTWLFGSLIIILRMFHVDNEAL